MASKFKGILDTAKDRVPAPEEAEPEAAPPPSPALLQTKKVGRPPAKRSDPNCVQVTAYIHKNTHMNVKIALLKSGRGQDFSDLVDSLLAEWLKSRS